jgi:hypothetical protein
MPPIVKDQAMDRATLEQIELFADVQGKRERVIGLNIGVTVFFRIPFRAQAKAVARSWAAYLRDVPWSTFKFQNLTGTARGYKKIAPAAQSTVSDWLAGARDYGSACSIWLKDGESPTDAGHHLFRLFGKDDPDSDSDSNFLQILYPADSVDRVGVELFTERLHEILDPLPYHSAYVGYTLGTSTLLQVSPYSDQMDARLFAVGKRFLGAEITRPHLENYEMAEHLRSPAWMTFISSELIDRIGGVKKVRAALKGDVGFRDTKHGVGIRAGERPALADKNRRQQVPVEQRALAGVLEPLYSKQPAYLFSKKPHEETVAWMRRLND